MTRREDNRGLGEFKLDDFGFEGDGISHMAQPFFSQLKSELSAKLGFRMNKQLRILVIADTHNKLPAKVLELAQSADEVWHLGDVCEKWIVDELRTVGPPVTLVHGNCDNNRAWALVCKLTRNGIRFRLQHISPPRMAAPE